MIRLKIFLVVIIIWLAGVAFLTPGGVEAQEPVVHALLFHSPSCSHCKTVIEEVLPPLQARFGSQLEILMVDTSNDLGLQLYKNMQNVYKPEEGRRGVPSLIVGDILLVGSREIPAEFPVIIESGLQGDGIDWPDLPGLEHFITDFPAHELETKSESNLDELVAWAALVVLVFTLIANGFQVWKRRVAWRSFKSIKKLSSRRNWLIPVLSVLGFYIAFYLAGKEITQTSVACGPLGGCDTVQNSKYAIFLGLPMGVWGMLAYALILVLWGLVEFSPRSRGGARAAGFFKRLLPWVRPAMVAFSFFCVAFSIFLTILEVMVIQATCTWCIGSAMVSAAINWAVTTDRKWLPDA